LQASYPGLTVVESERRVDESKFITSGGISSGIDMSLHLVAELAGLALAKQTARQMEFDWKSAYPSNLSTTEPKMASHCKAVLKRGVLACLCRGVVVASIVVLSVLK
jgi:transcriptional regulator GlxA family with amidase domain